MNEQTEDLLTGEVLEGIELPRRRSLLPLAIKFFTWVFLIMGAMTPFIVLMSLFGTHMQLALYGLSSYTALSPVGFMLTVVYLLKGAVAYGLWMEKEWAVQTGIIDAIIGFIICLYQMFLSSFLNGDGFVVSFRLELIALIAYILTLRNLYDPWKKAVAKS